MNGLVGIVDLDLLFQSPQKDARIIGGMGEESSFSRSAMECIFVLKSLGNIGEEDPFYSPLENMTVTVFLPPGTDPGIARN